MLLHFKIILSTIAFVYNVLVLVDLVTVLFCYITLMNKTIFIHLFVFVSEMYTNSFLISSPSKYVNEQISISNNNDFHSYNDNLLEEPIDFQYYNL